MKTSWRNYRKTATLYTSVPINIIEELRYKFEVQNPRVYLKIYRASTGKVIPSNKEWIEENRDYIVSKFIEIYGLPNN